MLLFQIFHGVLTGGLSKMALDDAKMAGLSQRRKIIDETTTERCLLHAVNWRAWEMGTIMLFWVTASHMPKCERN